jgi:hypothetical protein
MSDTGTISRTDSVELGFRVQEAWELGICTCCPNSYLLRLINGQYLYLCSWKLTPFAEAESFPTRQIQLVVNPYKRTILTVQIWGESAPKGAEALDLAATSEIEDGEYSLLNWEELPDVWRRTLNAA